MLTDQEIASKLRTQAEVFDHHYRRKDFLSARLTECRTFWLTRFMELTEEESAVIFGTRQTDEPIEGLFKEEKVLKAQLEAMRAGFDSQKMKYADVMAMWKKEKA